MSGDTENDIINKINENINTIKEINGETKDVLMRTLDAIDEKDAEIKTLNSDILNKEAQASSLQSNIDESNSEKEELKKQLDELNKKLEETANSDMVERENLRKQISEKQSSLASLQLKIENTKKELEVLVKELDETKDKLEKVERENLDLKKKLENINEQLNMRGNESKEISDLVKQINIKIKKDDGGGGVEKDKGYDESGERSKKIMKLSSERLLIRNELKDIQEKVGSYRRGGEMRNKIEARREELREREKELNNEIEQLTKLKGGKRSRRVYKSKRKRHKGGFQYGNSLRSLKATNKYRPSIKSIKKKNKKRHKSKKYKYRKNRKKTKRKKRNKKKRYKR